MAVTLFVRATYTEERALEKFFVDTFGWGKTTILWKRGRFQCTIPRPLLPKEELLLSEAVQREHYEAGS